MPSFVKQSRRRQEESNLQASFLEYLRLRDCSVHSQAIYLPPEKLAIPRLFSRALPSNFSFNYGYQRLNIFDLILRAVQKVAVDDYQIP